MHLSCLQSAINQEKKKKKFNKEAARSRGAISHSNQLFSHSSFYASQAIQQLIK